MNTQGEIEGDMVRVDVICVAGDAVRWVEIDRAGKVIFVKDAAGTGEWKGKHMEKGEREAALAPGGVGPRLGYRLGSDEGGVQEPDPASETDRDEVGRGTRGRDDELGGPARERPVDRLLEPPPCRLMPQSLARPRLMGGAREILHRNTSRVQ